MTARLFCTHCDKYYKVDVEDINLMQKYNGENMTYTNNTYHYSNSCFFQELKKVKNVK